MNMIKKTGKRTAKLLLAAGVMLAAVRNFGSTVFASERNGPYVLRMDEQSQPYLYGSRYECRHSCNVPQAGESAVWTYVIAPEIFNLVYSDADGSRSIAVYCTHADTGIYGDGSVYYRRINLEDSDYHESGAAARIRAVLLHSFPYLSVETVAANVNAVLGEGSIQELTQGEVLSATQQAVWEITHGDRYTVNDNYVGIRDMDAYDADKFVHPESLDDCIEGEFTENNMEQLYRYFLNLPGQSPMADAVSEFTFKDVVYDATQQEDGTYTVTANYVIDTILREGDSLTLTAVCGDQVQKDALAAGAGTVTFTGLADRECVTLTISGYQTGADVYLFDAQDGGGAAQSMVGYDSTTLPVFVQVTAEPDRVITIYKSTSEGENKRPLADSEFELYLVAASDDIAAGKVQLGEQPTSEEIAAYTEAEPITTLNTGAQGFATYNLTDNGYPDGVYLVVEKEDSSVIDPVEPFFAAVPGINEDKTGQVYAVTDHPKNRVGDGPEIRKDVTGIEKDEDSFGVEENHTWIIRGDVPGGIANAVRYVISDSLDYRLTLKSGFQVRVGHRADKAGTEAVTLIPGTDYTVTTRKAVDGEDHPIDTFTVTLTRSGMAAVARAAGDAKADFEVRVYYDAVIDSDAQFGVAISSMAKLEYVDETGIAYYEESDAPKVYTGGISIVKLDSGNSGAQKDAAFKIARNATAAEIAQGKSVTLHVDGEEKQVVFVPFYADAALTSKVQEYTITEDGRIPMYGLAYGNYYIVQTKAPEHYKQLREPVAVKIDGNSHSKMEAVKVYNAKFLLPETDGIGTEVFTACGLICIAGAFVLALGCMRRKESEYFD